MGVVGGLGAAVDAVAGVVDEVVGDHGALENVFDTAPAELGPEHGPEFAAVVGLNADLPEDSAEDGDGAGEVAGGCLANGMFGVAAIGIGFAGLSGVSVGKGLLARRPRR